MLSSMEPRGNDGVKVALCSGFVTDCTSEEKGYGLALEKPSEQAGTKPVQSVQRALRLLSMFTPDRSRGDHPNHHRSRWSVSDLARATGLHKSVVARLMATMALDGFVSQDPVTKEYRIGPQAFAVGNEFQPFAVLNEIARPTMEQLTQETGHATYLGVRAGAKYMIVVAVESIQSLRVTIDVGEQRPLHAGAMGKIFLAELSNDEVCELLGDEPLPQLTPRTIQSVDELLPDLDEIRQNGFALNREESILGAGSVAAGIYNARGQVLASLVVVYPIHNVEDSTVNELAVRVKAACEEIGNRLGSHSNNLM